MVQAVTIAKIVKIDIGFKIEKLGCKTLGLT